MHIETKELSQQISKELLPLLAEKVADILFAKMQGLTTKTTESSKTLLTTKEVCELLHISKPTLLRHTQNGTLTVKKIGKKNYYSVEQIQSFKA